MDNQPRVIAMGKRFPLGLAHLRLYFSVAGLKKAFARFAGLRDDM